MRPIKNQIQRLLEKDPKIKEPCGLVAYEDNQQCTVLQLENVHENPRQFMMRPEDLMDMFMSKSIVACWHAHLNGEDHLFSEGDMQGCEQAGSVYLVYSEATGKLNRYAPSVIRQSLCKRPFIPHIFDCFCLVQDYYFEQFGVQMESFQSEISDFRVGVPPEKEAEYLELNNLEVTDTPQNGSIVCYNISDRGPLINHIGIYEEGYLYHHSWAQESCMEKFNPSDPQLRKFLTRKNTSIL